MFDPNLSDQAAIDLIKGREPVYRAPLVPQVLDTLPPGSEGSNWETIWACRPKIKAEIRGWGDKGRQERKHLEFEFLLDSGAAVTVIPIGAARAYGFSFARDEKNVRYLVTSGEPSVKQSVKECEQLVRERRAFKGYLEKIELVIGKSEPFQCEVVFVEDHELRLPPLLGRHDVFQHLYFGVCQGMVEWQQHAYDIGEVIVWQHKHDTANGGETTLPFRHRGLKEPCQMLFDSGSLVSVFDNEFASTIPDLGNARCYPRMLKTPTCRVIDQTGTRTYVIRDGINSKLRKIPGEIHDHQFELWAKFPEDQSYDEALLGTCGVLSNFFVGFGAGPTRAIPLDLLFPASDRTAQPDVT